MSNKLFFFNLLIMLTGLSILFSFILIYQINSNELCNKAIHEIPKLTKMNEELKHNYLTFPFNKYDRYPGDQHLNQFIDKYKCVNYIKDNQTEESFAISLTSIPPRFGYIKSIMDQFNSSIIINLPETYKYFPKYEPIKSIKNLYVNLIKHDYGPANKILGLCNILHQLPTIIIYIDDDIDYNVNILRSLTKYVSLGYIIGGHGGFYTNIDDPNLYQLGYNYLYTRFNLPSCFVMSEVAMGFSGVAIHKNDLKKVCESPLLLKFKHDPNCYFIDDNWLSYIYKYIGLKILTNSALIASYNAIKSENDGWSNRNIYYKAYKECFSLVANDNSFNRNNILIRSALIEREKTLHNIDEYQSIKKIVRQNHYEFCLKHKYDYKLYYDTKLLKTHWVKIEIILDFLSSCSDEDQLFYTDYDFLFVNNNFPTFNHHSSWIMSKGCRFDEENLMVGNILLKCDKTLISFVNSWLKVTQSVSNNNIFNDDQIAFNIIKSDLAWRLQIEDFYRYDFCTNRVGLLGYHFPGGEKYKRMMEFLNKR